MSGPVSNSTSLGNAMFHYVAEKSVAATIYGLQGMVSSLESVTNLLAGCQAKPGCPEMLIKDCAGLAIGLALCGVSVVLLASAASRFVRDPGLYPFFGFITGTVGLGIVIGGIQSLAGRSVTQFT